MPAKKVKGGTEADVEAVIPAEHRRLVADTLAKPGVPELAEGEASGGRVTGWREQAARSQLDVAFDDPIRLLAHALGSPARPRPVRRPGVASSPRCPATPTARCTRGGRGTRTGRAAPAPPRDRPA